MNPSGIEGRRVLVTGGAGFIGSYLVEALVERGARVTVADDFSNGRMENLESVRDRIELARVDLCREGLDSIVSGREVIFHLAGHASVRYSLTKPDEDFDRNAVATLRVLEAVRRASPQASFLQTSSAAVYGRGSPRPMDEETATLPISPYGVSKLAAERYAAVYRGVYGLKTAILRLFPAYGPRQRQQVLYDFLVKLSKDPHELSIEGDGEQQRDFVHVRDVVAAFLLIAEKSPLSGEAYNVSGEEPIRIRDLAERAVRAMGLSARLRFDSQPRRGDAPHWIADTSRIRALGFRPTVPLSEGLAETVAWFRGLGPPPS